MADSGVLHAVPSWSSVNTPPPRSSVNPEHWVTVLGLDMRDHPGLDCRGWATVRPDMLGRVSGRPRVGILATMVDMVAGNPPWGPLTPTLDLRTQLLTTAPTEGRIRLDCRTLRAGRRFCVSETLLYADDAVTPFARATTTFLNNTMPDLACMRGPSAEFVLRGHMDDLLATRVLGPGVLAVDAHGNISNGPVGTVQGGAQAALAELTAEHALGPDGRFSVTDLDIRYLDKLRSGPLVATATVFSLDDRHAVVRVELTDAGADDAIVSHVTIGAAPLD